MALTPIEVTIDLADTPAVELNGVIKIRADGLDVEPYADPESRFVDIYEETTVDGEYSPVPVPPGIDRTRRLRLTSLLPSILFEGYGLYKFVASHDDITVGYASSPLAGEPV
jgi:hypothetical protein